MSAEFELKTMIPNRGGSVKQWSGPLAKARFNDDGLILPQPTDLKNGLWRTDKEMRPAHRADFYPTAPKIPIPALYQTLIAGPPALDSAGQYRILDLGAGTGIWGNAARVLFPNAIIVGVELRNIASPDHGAIDPWLPEFDPDNMPPTIPTAGKYQKAAAYDLWITGSALDDLCQDLIMAAGPYDLVIGNPPFSIAQELIEFAYHRAIHDQGHVIMLLRGAYLESSSRYESMYSGKTPLTAFWAFVKRPSFTEDGNTDMTMYALLLWSRGIPRTYDHMGGPVWAGGFFDYDQVANFLIGLGIIADDQAVDSPQLEMIF